VLTNFGKSTSLADFEATANLTVCRFCIHRFDSGCVDKFKKIKITNSGVDVMITNFCDFPPIFGKKLMFFLNTNVMIHFFQIFALF
jgi:hypothetical protein